MAQSEGSLRAYRLLLRLYPAQFRQEYEREIVLAFRNEWQRETSAAGRLLYFLVAMAGILANAPVEHYQMLKHDLRYSLRALRRSPWFATVTVGTVALGLSVNSALFSVVKAVLLDSLPYGHPDRIARVWVHNPQQGYEHDITNWPRLEDWRARSRSFAAFAGFTSSSVTLTGDGEPIQLQGAAVTANFLRVMGVTPAVGRDFEDGDDEAGRPRKVILGYGFWRRALAGDAAVVGRQLILSGETYRVIGVMPPRFDFPARDLDYWTALAVDARTRIDRGNFWLTAIGRLRDGVTLAHAQAEMDSIAKALAAQYVVDRNLGVVLVSLKDDLTARIRPALVVLAGAVIFILLICCANIAGMLLAHTASRKPELAIRTALGAGRERVVRQLLTEVLLLFCAGGAAGIAAAYAGVRLLLRLAPSGLPQLQDTKLDLTVAATTLIVSALTGLICGIWPAIEGSRLDVASALKQGGLRLAGRMNNRRLRSLLTVVEMALAMILLTGSWMLVRSMQQIEGVSLGFDERSVSVAYFQLPRARYANGPAAAGFYQKLLDNLRARPEVESAAAITNFLLGRLPDSGVFSIEGRKDRIYTPLTVDSVTPDLFAAMKIRLVRGRFFSAHDDTSAPPALIINQTTARRYWPNEDPIGKRLTFANPDDKNARWRTIVGVVADTERAGVDQPVFTESYSPLAQEPSRRMQVVIRSRGGAAAARAALASALREVDQQIAVSRFSTLDAVMSDQLAPRRFATSLLTLFAAAALLIAGVGLYGLIAYLAAQRTPEFAVRVALGARSADVVWMVVGRAVAMSAWGLALGASGALITSRLLESLLFGVTRFDPASYAAAAAALMAVCIAAAVPPAMRAVRVDPLAALRSQ
jgi:putative ABC transport system permease protein